MSDDDLGHASGDDVKQCQTAVIASDSQQQAPMVELAAECHGHT